jgi:type IV pilus modification protein PilV
MQLKRTHHDGVALLEALMALLLLASGVLAALWLQQIGLQTQRQQVNRSIAMGLADDLAERMRLNASQAALYTRSWGTAPSSTSPNCTALACTRSDLAQWDMAQLQQALSTQLPQGDAAVFALSGPSGWWGVVVAWHDSGENYRTDTAWGSHACPSAMSCWRLFFRPAW